MLGVVQAAEQFFGELELWNEGVGDFGAVVKDSKL